MAARPGHSTADTSRNWTSSIPAASAGSWAFHGRTVTNQEVLHRSSMPGVEVLIMKAPLRWTGHMMRMEDSRTSSETSVLNWLAALAGRGPRQSATKTPKNSLRACDIPVKGWEHLAADRRAWRLATHNGAQAFKERRLSQLDIKRHSRKDRKANPAADVDCPV